MLKINKNIYKKKENYKNIKKTSKYINIEK